MNSASSEKKEKRKTPASAPQRMKSCCTLTVVARYTSGSLISYSGRGSPRLSAHSRYLRDGRTVAPQREGSRRHCSTGRTGGGSAAEQWKDGRHSPQSARPSILIKMPHQRGQPAAVQRSTGRTGGGGDYTGPPCTGGTHAEQTRDRNPHRPVSPPPDNLAQGRGARDVQWRCARGASLKALDMLAAPLSAPTPPKQRVPLLTLLRKPQRGCQIG